MKPVFRGNTIRAMDACVIERLGLPGRQLMEHAAHAAALAVRRRWPGAPVAVLCGPGNNGGDGLAMARWLHLWGHPVRIWSPRQPDGDDARANRALIERLGLPLMNLDAAVQGARVVVDALLGTGQRAGPQGAALDGVRACRSARAAGAAIVCLDQPTGLHTDTGQPLGGADEVVQADLTLTFGFMTPGLVSAPGCALAGEVEVVDIGLGLSHSVDPALGYADMMLLEDSDLQALLPADGQLGAKWDRGHVAIQASGGAAVLAAEGALSAGVGLVTVLCPREDWGRLHGLAPEVVLAPPEALDPERHDVVVVGPGLGAAARAALLRLEAFPGLVLVDADAIVHLNEASAGLRARVAFTPHSAEAARLLGLRRGKVEADRLDALRLLRPFGLPVLKGPGTLIAQPPGGSGAAFALPFADERLATGGSGDVLAGLLGGLMARAVCKQNAPLAATLAAGAYLHGATIRWLPPRARASQIAAALPQAWSSLAGAPAGSARPRG